jgi:single-stranded DNA-binding protein
MNICSFTGFILEDPVLEQKENVGFLEFELITYSYRRAKSTGEKSRIPTILRFEAWHTGAETIAKLAQKGDKMTVYASARNRSRDDDTIIFRVNEFDFGCLNPE